MCGVTQAKAQTTFTYDNLVASAGPVVVYGSANEGEGRRNTFLLEQPNEDNPLGNPIMNSSSLGQPLLPSAQEHKNKSLLSPVETPSKMIQESLPVNPQLSSGLTPQKQDKQIQNTLYESGDRIYDLQSYPVKDVDYIETPNINPTITTYLPI